MNPRAFLFLLGIALLIGCGDVPTAKPQAAAKPKKAKKEEPPPTPKVEVKADAFASVQEAITAMVAAHETNDQKQVYIADEWIKMQGEKAGPVLIETLKNEQAPLAARIASCRMVGRLGVTAKEPLMSVLESSAVQLRVKACETLAGLKPPSKEVIAKMLALVDGKEERLRLAALNALRIIGPAAKEAEPKLLAILNSKTENDALRDAAKAALKSCAPRKTFADP